MSYDALPIASGIDGASCEAAAFGENPTMLQGDAHLAIMI